MEKEFKDQNLTIKSLVAILMSDIDIFLLKEPDQTTDKNKLFTLEEIRNRLTLSGQKTIASLQRMGVDTDFEIPSRERAVYFNECLDKLRIKFSN